MVFSSTIFLFAFLPVVWLINRLIPQKASNALLCAASLLFYAWAEPFYVVLLVGSVAFNYLCTLRMPQKTGRQKKWLLAIDIAGNLLLLGMFKYADFAIGTVNSLFGASIPLLKLGLPIGISFFTFHCMSYSIEVYRGITKPQKKLYKLLLYVSFFPQLVAGPIVKYHDIEEQIDNRRIELPVVAQGIQRFIVGLSKKVLIANTLGIFVDKAYATNASSLSTGMVWLAAIAYALQLYYDFSGYSDMALGLARMFGFRFLENFDYPYAAQSLRDFWRRWHISLGTWFRDYVYIPLGGNRKGEIRAGINRLIVFFLTGLWHGAQWTFVVWGLWHGLFLMLETYGLIRFDKKLAFLGRVYTLLVAIAGFVLFRAQSFAQAIALLSRMAGIGGLAGTASLLRWTTTTFYLALIFALLGCTPWLRNLYLRFKHKDALPVQALARFFTIALLALCLLSIASLTNNPFIYFRF